MQKYLVFAIKSKYLSFDKKIEVVNQQNETKRRKLERF